MASYRNGIGYDIHRTTPDRPLMLAGVRVPHTHGLLGHSDADVVLHAVCDALLGAAGLGDIGELFPDTDPANAGADSRRFVGEVVRRVGEKGCAVEHLDVVILAERPRISPHKAAMRASLAQLLCVPPGHVNVKAGTNEGLDAVGRGDAIACWAVATVRVGPARARRARGGAAQTSRGRPRPG